MVDSNIPGQVRKAFAAFLSHDRQSMEGLLSDDFTFNSPRDDHLTRPEFFERCFPYGDQFRSLELEQIFVQGNEAFVRYRAERLDGTRFRNTEYLRFAGDQIVEEDVYFGAEIQITDR